MTQPSMPAPKALDAKQLKKLLEIMSYCEVHGARVITIQREKPKKIGNIYLPDNSQVPNMGAVSGLVLRSSRDLAAQIQNKNWDAQSGSDQIEPLEVGEVKPGDVIWYAPFAGQKVRFIVDSSELICDVVNWSDILLIQRDIGFE